MKEKACLLIFLWALPWGCQPNKNIQPPPLKVFSQIEYPRLSFKAISLKEVAGQSPWKNWDLEIFRPESAWQLEFENVNRQKVKVFFVQFAEDYLAFGLFKRYALENPMNDFFYFSSEEVVLHNYDFICSFHLPGKEKWTLLKFHEFQKIVDKDYSLPMIFQSLPVKNRIQNSEWVQPRYFLGLDNIGETVGIKYPCMHEEALLFRTIDINSKGKLPRFTKDFQKKKLEQKGDEQIFWGKTEYGEGIYLMTQKWGFLGFLGCSDYITAQSMVGTSLKMNGLMP